MSENKRESEETGGAQGGFCVTPPLPDAGSAAGTPARADGDEASDEGGAPPSGQVPSLLGLAVRWDPSSKPL